MFQFENIEILWLLLVLAVLLALYIIDRYRANKSLRSFGNSEIVKSVFSEVSKFRRFLKLSMLLLAIGLVIIAIANLQAGTKLQRIKREGGDLIICLDVSKSMLAEDLSPNRIERSKLAIENLIDQLKGDRIGLVVFAGHAYVKLPITTDYNAAKLFLQGINTDMVPTQGTDIGEAIEQAISCFGKDVGKSKAIIVITDGEDHEEIAIEQAKKAAKKGITVHTIGVGSAQGVPIPEYDEDKKVGLKRDQNDNVIITKLNENLLNEIASATGGVYVKASNADMGLSKIRTEINKMAKKEIDSNRFSDYEDQFQWFILGAIILLVIEMVMKLSPSKWFKKLSKENA